MYNKEARCRPVYGRGPRAITIALIVISLIIFTSSSLRMKFSSSLITISTFILPSLAGHYDDYNSPYSFDANYAHHPSWMSAFPNSTNLTSLSIPGTHDTMTSSAALAPVYQCQNHRLAVQLEAGIRYIDVRGTVVNNSLYIYHFPEYTGFSYTDVLKTLFSFLSKNPSEVILMRLKEESPAINSTMTFEESFNYYRLIDPETAPGCAKYFWIPPSPGPTAVPTLGDLRSKILIIQNFGPNPAPYGIKYESPLLVIEDYYQLNGFEDMDSKFDAIEANLLAAANGSSWNNGQGDGLLYLSHVSASVGVIPIEVAAGTHNRTIKGENDRTGEWLASHADGNGSTGVVILDFPGQKLVEEVLARNHIESCDVDAEGCRDETF
jgi:1-phosphatidylinositol phosphodiesterase